ncbi:hypothetical protein KJ909_00950, partial [Patescibacteria group bacterium]|nr:hypothetical protein [Patescibacteria group bacterium]
PFYTGIALMTEEDVIKKLPDKQKIGVITSAPLEEVKIPGYHTVRTQQFGSLSFLWIEKE